MGWWENKKYSSPSLGTKNFWRSKASTVIFFSEGKSEFYVNLIMEYVKIKRITSTRKWARWCNKNLFILGFGAFEWLRPILQNIKVKEPIGQYKFEGKVIPITFMFMVSNLGMFWVGLLLSPSPSLIGIYGKILVKWVKWNLCLGNW